LPATLVLFDGVCGLCNGFVDFLLPRDPQGALRFGALQSEAGKKALRDVVYRFIARNRYGWFGKRDSCRIPSPAERARFLS
jgi:predicted DCC family thiol-disulfide oxidoreductase YuxK